MTVPATTLPSYADISPNAFQHPADRAATAALGSIPLLDMVLKKLSAMRFERSFQQLLLANAVRVGDHQLPELWRSHLECTRALDLASTPDLYVRQLPLMNALTVGSSRPVVIVNSALLSGLPGIEQKSVLAHEAGHVLSDHVHYATVLAIVQRLVATGLSPLGRLPLQALLLVLLEWYRCAELSCDRAATLVVGDPLVTCRVLMDMAGGGVAGLDLNAFLQQANEYAETEDLLARPGRFLTEINQTHPFAVRRVNELMRWVSEGDYDRIRAGSYLRRGQEPPPSDQFQEATEHYRRRFLEIVDRLAGGVQKLGSQVLTWLRDDDE
ncbi:MAG: hypothetical protein JWM85_2287 [Acidimicrobiaceae bacterium]|nr:hypothetical protein [Acidimicrobiaceae bacterium]